MIETPGPRGMLSQNKGRANVDADITVVNGRARLTLRAGDVRSRVEVDVALPPPELPAELCGL